MDTGTVQHVKNAMKRNRTWLLDLNPRQYQCFLGMHFENLAELAAYEVDGQIVERMLIPKIYGDKITAYERLRRERKIPKCKWAQQQLKLRKK